MSSRKEDITQSSQEAQPSNGKTEELNGGTPTPPPTPASSVIILVILVITTYVTLPDPLQPVGKPSLQHVWYYGWLTAVSTGLGVLPLVFVPNMDSYWVGISNGVAAGMMVAASYSLFLEGCVVEEMAGTSHYSSHVRTLFGAILGLVFITGTKKFLDAHEGIHVGSLGGADARRALLIFMVMTLHSFSEGVGIGVSFGGGRGSELGVFISASLAVHNVPEGLAIAVSLLPQGVPTLTAGLLGVLSSIPQPLMAVPAYLFVNSFIPILPVGLGFAGGAMAWVAFFELLLEAYEDTDLMTTALVSMASLIGMLWLQNAIDETARS